MKNIILTSVALAAIAAAAPAFADEGSNNHDVTIQINGSTPAKCNINSDGASVTLADYDLTNDQGRVRNNVDNKIAQALTGLNLRAWCTGGHNGVVLSRSSLATGDGNAANGFNQAIIYDLNMEIEGATRGNEAFYEGTSDGQGNGPGVGVGAGIVVPAFGPTGQGSKISFIREPGSQVAAVSEGHQGSEGPRSLYTGENNARMVAGNYTGTVTVTLTPGL